jgi:hypothetical protein
LRAKRSNPSQQAKKGWIASSQMLLAMTWRELNMPPPIQAIAFISMDCRVKPGNDETEH